MKFTDILTATNLNPNYYKIIPVFIKTWLNIFPEINIHIILIADEIIEELRPYEKYIKLFKPINNINTALIAQYIRILYPCLLTEAKGGIMITDMDMLPMGRKYYIEQIKNINNNKFICYRPLSCVGPNEMVICYNIAHNNIWKDIFKISDEKDIINKLIDVNKNNYYEGKHGGMGWNLDQLDLYSITQEWNIKTNNLIILDTNIYEIYNNNLPKRNDYYVRLWNHYNIYQIKYFLEHDNIVDFHLPKPYNKELSDKVLELLPNNNSIDKIYIINLKERTDRKEHILKELNKFNIKNYEIIEAIKPTIEEVNLWSNKYCDYVMKDIPFERRERYKIGCLGCLKSHLFIYNEMIKNNYNNILILEDDCIIKDDINKYKNNINYCIQNNYGLFYLGGTHSKNPIKINDNFYKCEKTHTTHSYMISKDCAKYIIDNINNYEKEIDVYLSEIIQKKFNCYCLYPSIFSQKDGISDIQGSYVQYQM